MNAFKRLMKNRKLKTHSHDMHQGKAYKDVQGSRLSSEKKFKNIGNIGIFPKNIGKI